MGRPQIESRSVTDVRWGEMYVPVVNPWAHARAAISRAVVVLPFVPVIPITCISALGWR